MLRGDEYVEKAGEDVMRYGIRTGCLQSQEMRPVHHYKQTLSAETTVV